MIRKDMREKPVRRMVVMGESNAYGMSATSPRNEWVQVLGDGIREFQDGPVRIFNNAQPSNVISPDAPGYVEGNVYMTAPSAIERFEADMIGYKPDMAVYAYGLNDSRCGHEIGSFMKAYTAAVARTREALPDALVVLVGPYWNLQYDAETWAQPQYQGISGKFNLGGDELVLAYNEAIEKMAKETGSLFVDVYHALEGAPWLITGDTCHFNDVGQKVIGLTVLCGIAANCSFLTHSSLRMEKDLNSSVHNTGGTNALPHVIDTWRKVDRWRK